MFKIENDLIRIFVLPLRFPKGFCFGGPRTTLFHLVDWFKVFGMETLPVELDDVQYEVKKQSIIDCIKGKEYYCLSRKYIVITAWEDCFFVK